MDTFDTLVFAIIAIVIFARLWIVLGRRNDEDRERPNPFAPTPPPQDVKKSGDDTAYIPGRQAGLTAMRVASAAPDSLMGGLEQIKSFDPTFDEKQFLQTARIAFNSIINGFTQGDLTSCARLLNPQVLARFRAAIDARKQAGHVIDNKVERLREAETAAAKVEGTKASITVRFVTDQQNVVRDAGGNVVSGSEGRLEEITDLWTFGRDFNSSDPTWILIETRS